MQIINKFIAFQIINVKNAWKNHVTCKTDGNQYEEERNSWNPKENIANLINKGGRGTQNSSCQKDPAVPSV